LFRTRGRAFGQDGSDAFDFISEQMMSSVSGVSITVNAVAPHSSSSSSGDTQWSFSSISCAFELETGQSGILFAFHHEGNFFIFFDLSVHL
jgi:hypothetical protein